MFEQFKLEVQKNFNKLAKDNEVLFYVTIDRDKIFEVYLSAFPEETRQESNCNSCKSFLRQWGGIVAIIDNKVVSIWDGIELDEYTKVAKALSKYIHSLPITDVFYNEFSKCGTNENLSIKSNIVWKHFYIELPMRFVHSGNIDASRGEKRDNKQVLKRSFEELTIDATETILELIAQNSLYRGKESEGLLTEFLKLQKAYEKVPNALKDNYCWIKSTEISQAMCRIRNTAIGTLLVNLSEGMDLETAVTKFEQVVAPANYKRPNSLVTPKMVEEAKQKLIELGFVDSLERRFATEADLNINDILYTDVGFNIDDVFEQVAKEQLVNPKTLGKVEEIGIDNFIKDVLPKIKSVELLLENSHLPNMVSLLTGKNADAPSFFKWDNPFSWNYTGAIADSMKERVKAAGGKVDGDLRFSIQWNEDGKSIIDLDAHAWEPDNTHIFYSSQYRKDRGGRRTPMTGQLDVDMINPITIGVENITWSDRNKMGNGIYKLKVHNYSGHKRFSGVRCEVEFDGEVYEFEHNKPFTNYVDIAEVTKQGDIFSIKSLIDFKSSVFSKEKWGIKTNQFHKVNKMMLSPNFWGQNTGNKHYLFFLENCKTDESPRPFFNEFLKPELDEHRKVFEILGSKVKVEDSDNQLSGLGFSETQRNHAILRVDGKFKRILKILF